MCCIADGATEGKVIGIVRRGFSALLNVEDHLGEEVAIRVIEMQADGGSPVTIRIGDTLRLVRGKAIWVPRGGQEVALGRIAQGPH